MTKERNTKKQNKKLSQQAKELERMPWTELNIWEIWGPLLRLEQGRLGRERGGAAPWLHRAVGGVAPEGRGRGAPALAAPPLIFGPGSGPGPAGRCAPCLPSTHTASSRQPAAVLKWSYRRERVPRRKHKMLCASTRGASLPSTSTRVQVWTANGESLYEWEPSASW